jgi:PhnB protein
MPREEGAPSLQFTVDNAAEAIAFYTSVFGAVELQRECLLDARPVAAELVVGEFQLTVSEWEPSVPARSLTDDENHLPLTLECDDPEALVRRATAGGASVGPGGPSPDAVIVTDPVGQRWAIVSRRHNG